MTKLGTSRAYTGGIGLISLIAAISLHYTYLSYTPTKIAKGTTREWTSIAESQCFLPFPKPSIFGADPAKSEYSRLKQAVTSGLHVCPVVRIAEYSVVISLSPPPAAAAA